MAKKSKYNEEFGAGSFGQMPSNQSTFGGFDSFSTSNNNHIPSFDSNNQMMPPFGNEQQTPKRQKVSLPNFYGGNIPWAKIAIVLGAIVAIVLMIIFRKEITSFLLDLVTWAIIIAALYFIIRRFLLRR